MINRKSQTEESDGKDRVLGINFFIGYGFHITATKFVLSKHRYDSNVLVQIPSFPIMMRTRCYLADVEYVSLRA